MTYIPTLLAHAVSGIRVVRWVVPIALLVGSTVMVNAYDTYSSPVDGPDGQGVPIGDGYALTNWWSNNQLNGWASTLVFSSTCFSVVWDINSYGFLNQVGIRKVYQKMDSMNTYAWCYHNHGFSNRDRGAAYTGFYGWMYDPSIEFYIIDDWFGPRPQPSTAVAAYSVDGQTYDIYHLNGGSYGNWPQWWSVNRNHRTNGSIHYVQHFQKWRTLGMANATLNFCGFALESAFVGNSSSTKGQVDYYQIIIPRP